VSNPSPAIRINKSKFENQGYCPSATSVEVAALRAVPGQNENLRESLEYCEPGSLLRESARYRRNTVDFFRTKRSVLKANASEDADPQLRDTRPREHVTYSIK
jgi:hypothetical protein